MKTLAKYFHLAVGAR